jgi:hypothetical protein
MMRVGVVRLAVIANVVCCAGCDDSFTPDGPYKEKLVVFGVLSTRSDTQFVRVQTTYRSPIVPAETQVTDAQVRITTDDTVFQFRDTVLARTDTSHSTTGISAYVAYGLRLVPGVRYDLSVSSPSHGTVSSHTTSLYRGSLIPQTDPAGGIAARVYPGVNSRAHIVRLYLEYEVRVDTSWVAKETEIPSSVSGTGEFVFPKPVSREYTGAVFDAPGYAAVVAQLRQRYPGGMVRLTGTHFLLTQLDAWIYAYYSTVNGFPDSGTLRLDEPDFTNIEGGFGVFAASSETIVAADTAGHAIQP